MKRLQLRGGEQVILGQENAMAHVQGLSMQLLTLAETLEMALAQRNREVHSLRFELLGGKSGLSQSLPEGGLPRQSSEELAQLPALLTSKVLELKRGLSFLFAATAADTRAAPADDGDDEPTATFILKVPSKGRWGDGHNCAQADAPESPIPTVTIAPTFWKRNATENRDKEQQEGNRDSYCSAVSSASATSSVCDEDDEMEGQKEENDTDEEENASDDDTKNINTSQLTLGHDDTHNIDSQPEENECHVDENMGNNDRDESDAESARTDSISDPKISNTINTSSDKKCEHLSTEDDKLQAKIDTTTKSKHINDYETEVLPVTKSNSGIGRMRKLLKTRRVSDTYVGYSCKENSRCSSDLTSQAEIHGDEDNSDEDVNIGDTSSNNNVSNSYKFRLCESRRNSRLEREVKIDSNGNQRTILDRPIHLSSHSNYSELRKFPEQMDDRPASSLKCVDGIVPSSYKEVPMTEDLQNVTIPSNVFVKTTRKIFSPVRRDSKGKASSVISVIVGESQNSCERDPSSEPCQDTPAGMRNNYSPVLSHRWRQRGSNSEAEERASTPPAWMLRRSRSQSSSPAMSRRWEDTHGNAPPGIYTACPAISGLKSEQGATMNENQNPSDVLNESTDTSSTSQDEIKAIAGKSLSRQQFVKTRPDIHRDSSSEKSGSDRVDGLSPSSCPTTPSAGFPPVPHSPGPSRRDIKIASPSIRMMIAKYNQKLTEQDGAGGRSPEVGGSGSGSPVAWRSPVAERRVRVQMERYQEEVRRVLQQGGKKVSSRLAEVQKSASAGVIRSPEPSTSQQVSSNTMQDENNPENVAKKPPSLTQRRGILKSSSAGAIKTTSSIQLQSKTPTLGKMPEDTSKTSILPPTEPFKDGSSNSGQSPLPVNSDNTVKLSSPHLTISPSPSSPSSPEISLKNINPPPSRIRALKLKRAKEEFLTRGPGGQSWTSEDGTPSASVSPEPTWTRENSDRSRDRTRCRLSQISMGSESSYDGSLMLVNKSSEDERMLLVKSASAGMINVDPNTYRRFSAERSLGSSLPRSNEERNATTQKNQQGSKFGISSITSRFRKVKMRRSNKDKEKEKEKEKDSSRMNTVSMLCRQSLLVDIHLSRDKQQEAVGVAVGPVTSKSCPSSPVLQRSPPRGKGDEGTSSWLRNPARKIFKPK